MTESPVRSPAFTRSGPPEGGTTNQTPLFEDVSAQLNHRHHEEVFDDFARQPLLPRRLSQSGPAVAWLDLDGDGTDELVIGSGRGGALSIFKTDGHGQFQPIKAEALSKVLPADLTGLAGWRDAAGQAVLLAALSNYELARTNTSAVLKYALSNGTWNQSMRLSAPG